MKTLVILLLGAFVLQPVIAQNDLIVFSDDGKDFYLHVNGIQRNESPNTNVRAKNITNGVAAVRVVFADESAPDITKNISFLEKNTEVTAKITLTKKGYRLKYFGEAPLGTTAIAESDPVSDVAIDEDTPKPVESEINSSVSSTTDTQTETVTTTTTIQSQEIPEGESVSMGISIDGFNMEMNVDVDVSDDIQSTQTTTSTTTTTVTSSGASEDYEAEQYEAVETSTDYSDTRCPQTLKDVSELKGMIEDESFSDDQLNIAKQALRGKCIMVQGVIELAELFSFEDDRLDFVKFCYDRTVDQGEFYKVNSVFEFSSTKDELNEFLETR